MGEENSVRVCTGVKGLKRDMPFDVIFDSEVLTLGACGEYVACSCPGPFSTRFFPLLPRFNIVS